MNILVLCTGNSARSILLEAILADLGYNSFSAGSKPVGAVHPVALDTLRRHKVQVNAPRSKSWDEFATVDSPMMDLVVTVCGNAAGESCPIWPAKDGVRPIQVHWGIEDPAAANKEDQVQAFEVAFNKLLQRGLAFHDLKDKRDLSALASIGTLS